MEYDDFKDYTGRAGYSFPREPVGTATGDSIALQMPLFRSFFTMVLSSISGGKAKVQYCFAHQEDVIRHATDDSIKAVTWYDWAPGYISEDHSTTTFGPCTFIRIKCDVQTVKYRFEVLGDT